MSHELDKPQRKPRKDLPRTDERRQQRTFRNANRGGAFECDFREADGTKVTRAIHAITQRGGAIQFGLTRDGGAFAIRILGDGEPYNEYVRPTEDINLWLDEFTNHFLGRAEAAPTDGDGL